MASLWENCDQICLQKFLGLFFLKKSPVFNEILPVFNQILPVFYTKNSLDPGNIFPGNGKFENAGNPGNFREQTLGTIINREQMARNGLKQVQEPYDYIYIVHG